LALPVADDVFTTEAQSAQRTHRDGRTTEMTCLRFAAGSDPVGHSFFIIFIIFFGRAGAARLSLKSPP